MKEKMGFKVFSVPAIILLLFALIWPATIAKAEPHPEPVEAQVSWQPLQLLYFDPAVGDYVEADPIEPDFDEPPQRYLYSIETGKQYLVRLDLPAVADDDVQINAEYTSRIAYGELGTISVEVRQTVNDIEHLYDAVLKFVASGDLQLSDTPPQIEDGDKVSFSDNSFSFILQDCDALERPSNQYDLSNAHITIKGTPDTAQDLYTTDINDYLYPDAA